MSRQKILLAIPLAISGSLLLYSWTYYITEGILPGWQNIIGVLLFIPLPILFFKNERHCLLATGAYLLVGTFGLFALTPGFKRFSFGLKISEVGINTPMIQLSAGAILLLFCILNFKSLAYAYIDYKEKRIEKARNAGCVKDKQ